MQASPILTVLPHGPADIEGEFPVGHVLVPCRHARATGAGRPGPRGMMDLYA